MATPLPGESRVIARLATYLYGERLIRDLQLLEAQDIRLMAPQPRDEALLPGLDRVHVPRGEAHPQVSLRE